MVVGVWLLVFSMNRCWFGSRWWVSVVSGCLISEIVLMFCSV